MDATSQPVADDGLTPARLVDLERIRQLKYRYFRGVDLKDFSLVASCFTPDGSATYGGKFTYDGPEAIVAFLDKVVGRRTLLTSHHLHHPEIRFVSDDEAMGVWSMEDVVIDLDNGVTLRGAAFYDDRYVRRDGRWLMASTVYRRTYEQMRPTPADATITASWFGTNGETQIPYDQL